MKEELFSQDGVLSESIKTEPDESGEAIRFEKKVKQEPLEDDDNEHLISAPILCRCFVNLHNGTDLNAIAKCPKCPHKSSENFLSIKRDNFWEDQSFILKEKNESFKSEIPKIKCEYAAVEIAPSSRRYCLDIIELSSDTDEDCNGNSISNFNEQNSNKDEEYNENIVKTEIKEENADENFSQQNSGKSMFSKEENFEQPDYSIFETNSKFESMEEDFNQYSPETNFLFCKEENIEESGNSGGENNENSDKDQPLNDIMFSDKKHPEITIETILKTETDEQIEEKLAENNQVSLENMEKLRLLQRFCDTSFECEYCRKRFTQKSFMKAHVEVVHLGRKPYKCKKCGKPFKYLVSRRQHYFNDHKDIKTYQCLTCGKQFLTNGWYQKHKCTMRKFKK